MACKNVRGPTLRGCTERDQMLSLSNRPLEWYWIFRYLYINRVYSFSHSVSVAWWDMIFSIVEGIKLEKPLWMRGAIPLWIIQPGTTTGASTVLPAAKDSGPWGERSWAALCRASFRAWVLNQVKTTRAKGLRLKVLMADWVYLNAEADLEEISTNWNTYILVS